MKIHDLQLKTFVVIFAAIGPTLLHFGSIGSSIVRAERFATTVTVNNQCIEPNVYSEVFSCDLDDPTGASSINQSRNIKKGISDRSLNRKEEDKNESLGPSIQIDRATRQNRKKIEARAWDFLRKEVFILERLADNTSIDSPKRPDILLRLAETYYEMQQAQRVRVRGYDDPIFEACQGEKETAECRKQMKGQETEEKQLRSVQEKTNRVYAKLIKDHPDFGKIDKVLFSLAFGLEDLGQFDKARKVYLKLISDFPNSRFVPNAYLSFGEYYFNNGDMESSLQFYDKVKETPPEKNLVYGYSIYKKAWAHFNIGDFGKSLDSFIEVIEFADRYPEAHDAENLSRQSRKELVIPYSRVGKPEKALAFFQRYMKSREKALRSLEKLGELYFDGGQWEDAIVIYKKLISVDSTNDQVCYWQTRVAQAAMNFQPKDKQGEEVEQMVRLYKAFESSGKHSEKSVRMCQQETAYLLVWLATEWHREAVGTSKKKGTNNRVTMRAASRLYQLLVDEFPDLDEMEFPQIDKRDWPTQYRVSYFRAELLWKMEDWQECGPAFDRVVMLDPNGEFTDDAAYASVLCYNNYYVKRYKRGEVKSKSTARSKKRRGRKKKKKPKAESFQPKKLSKVEEGMLGSFKRFMCQATPKNKELPVVKYRRARIYYESNRFKQAALLFKDIAINHKKSELSLYAANLYLDSLNILGTKLAEPNPSCIHEIQDTIEPMAKLYCKAEAKEDDQQRLCDTLGQLRCDVLRKEAESYEGLSEWKKAALTYTKIYRSHQECGRLDEVLYNAAIDFEAARLLGQAIKSRRILINEFPQSPLAKRSVYLIGANYHALGFYSRAAAYYEKFAEEFPGEDGKKCTAEDKEAGVCPIAPDALKNAVLFRIGLGNTDKAIEDTKLFEKNYRKKMPVESSNVNFSIGTIYEREEKWSKLVRHYRSYLRTYRRKGELHQLVQASVKMAKAFQKLEEYDSANKYFETAIKAYNATKSKHKNLKPLDLLALKTAVSEAVFSLAERKYKAFRRIRFPKYDGGRTLWSVNKWAKKDFAKWLKLKIEALRKAEEEFNKVAEYEVPSWMIAASARIGEMYRSFVDDFRDAPVPKEIENNPDLFDVYVGALDKQSEPLLKQAIDKFEFCILTSTNTRFFSNWSKQCEEELNKLNPTKYPLAAELRGKPNDVFIDYGSPGPIELQAQEENRQTAPTPNTNGGK